MTQSLNPAQPIYDHESFELSTEKAIEWLKYNANPHAVIVVSSTDAVLYTGEISVSSDPVD